jgi:hypothetical protein
VLDRLHDVPVMVVDAAWQIVAMNDLSRALLGDDERNVLRRHFAGEPSRVLRTPAQVAHMEAAAVADLHAAAGRYPNDEPLHELIADLRATSTRFAELWEQRPVARHISDRKTIDHPEVGRVTVDCDELTVAGSDLRIIVYSAPPGSDDARALALLSITRSARDTAGV